MAEDIIELGIEGIDKLVDKHFHKVPDKLVDKHTYHPHCRARGSGERRRDEEGKVLPVAVMSHTIQGPGSHTNIKE